MLKAANEILQEKVSMWSGFKYKLPAAMCHIHGKCWLYDCYCMQIVEQNGLLDVGMMVAGQQNGHFSTVPLIEEITNPLTILSGYSRGSEMGYSF
jgi:hypothetical protein